MVRLILLLVLIVFLARALWRVIDGIAEGLRGVPPKAQPPVRGVPMQRDPVCGTFVLPDRAVTLAVGREHLYFCSTRCRDKYRARTA